MKKLKPVRCRCGRIPAMKQGLDGYYCVTCLGRKRSKSEDSSGLNRLFCWCGPERKGISAAIRAWNIVMEKK